MIQQVELIGYLAGLLGLIAWMPQFQTVWFKRLHHGLDLRTCWIVTAALITWCVYGYHKQAWAVCFSNLASGVMIMSIIFRVKQLRRVEHNTGQWPQNLAEPHVGYPVPELSDCEKRYREHVRNNPDKLDPTDGCNGNNT